MCATPTDTRVPRYIVGIDLGTTHTVVAYAQPESPHAPGQGAPAIALLDIPQCVSPGAVDALPLLPSVRYHAAPGELAEGDLALPWSRAMAQAQESVVMGQLARRLGAQVPGRLVSSAKSWLSHAAVDRQAPILPWGAASDVPKVSPVQASADILAYVRAAWNTRFPNSPLEQQDIVLTLPASFDESARALTVQAAHHAGLPTLRLLEEPQAAFYDWLLRHRTDLASELANSRLVLVCDVGGGTTDLSLIQVDMQNGQPQLTRIGVGNHLMLGGDNMDLALAHTIEGRMANATDTSPALSAGQLAQLMERCRNAKELLLAHDAPAQTSVTLLGAGGRLIGASRSAMLTRTDVETFVLDGFFPVVNPEDPPPPNRRGLVAFGLPYARDPAITRHIAEFLRQHAPDGKPMALPDTLLLNGGVFRAHALVQRLQDTLAMWCGAPLRLLHNDNPDVAVARGAVAYALAQRGQAPAINAGSAHSFFLLLQQGAQARPDKRMPQGVCILPRLSEAGHEIRLSERTFALRLGQPVRFHLYSASADGAHHAPYVAGQIVDLDDTAFVRLPPIVTALPATAGGPQQKDIPVQLVATFTELGTLALHCVSVADASQRWLLEFDLRHRAALDDEQGDQPAPDAVPSARLAEAVRKIDRIFGTQAQKVDTKEVRQLRVQLEQVLGPREQWSIAVLRPLFDALWHRARGRRRSVEHERVWFNLAGYSLRPGYGDALDAWRMQQLWALFPAGVQFSRDKPLCAQWWTLWRRVAGGLTAEQQLRLLNDFASNLQSHTDSADSSEGAPDAPSQPVAGNEEDMLRLGAALERIPPAYKAEVGVWLLGRIQQSIRSTQRRGQADAPIVTVGLWALGRMGARVPVYGSTHEVVPPDAVTPWVDALLVMDWKRLEVAAFATTHMARVTDDRVRDLPLALREQVMERLRATGAPNAWIEMVHHKVELDATAQNRLVGESLPPGLTLIA